MPSAVAQLALDKGFPQELIFTPERAGEVSNQMYIYLLFVLCISFQLYCMHKTVNCLTNQIVRVFMVPIAFITHKTVLLKKQNHSADWYRVQKPGILY